jgi:ABC-type enterochelin transport system permease subunit
MAEHASDYTRGEMIVEEHERTFSGFIKLTKWGSLYIAAMLMLLTLWFCTSAGFLGGMVVAAVIVVLGTLVLREKHTL